MKMNYQSAEHPKGTLVFNPPEAFEDYIYNKNGDVYAFAMITYEIMTLKETFACLNRFNLALKVYEGYRPEFDSNIADCYRKLISRCWAKNQLDRPTFEEIIYELNNNKEFLIDGVDKNEFYNYIESDQAKLF